MCVCVCVCVEREECEDGRVGVIEGILSNSWAALWLLIGTLSDWIVNMEHHCAFGGVYILCFIYPMLSHDQPVYYTVQSTIKMKSGSKAKKKKKPFALARAALTQQQTEISVLLENFPCMEHIIIWFPSRVLN